MFLKAGTAPSAVKSLSLAILAGLAFVVWSTALGDSLASWSLTGSLNGNTSIAANSSDSAIVPVSLVRANGTDPAGTSSSGFGAKINKVVGDDAEPYFEISFIVAPNYTLTLTSLTNNIWISNASTSPKSIFWRVMTGSEIVFTGSSIPVDENATKATAAQGMNVDFSVSTLENIPAGTVVTIQLLGANSNKGNLSLYKTLSIEGMATPVSSGDPIPPDIGAIGDQTCFVGDALSIPLSLSGDPGEAMSTNHTCLTAGVTGTYTTDGAVFEYTPSAADAETNGGEIWFRIEYVIDNLAATNDFRVAVSVKPDFLEGFEKPEKKTTYYNSLTEIIGDASKWQGTNFLVNGRPTDTYRGTQSLCFRDTGTAYIEMSENKANGAGSVSFWHGKAANDTTSVTVTLDVFISNNEGITWTPLNAEPIIVSNEFIKTSFENVNVGGNVRLRFEKTSGNKRIYIDDILITDYDGPAVYEPAIGEIGNQTIHADESCEVGIVFYGDEGLARSVECTTPGVDANEYEFNAATGAFSFSPSLADLALNGGVIGFSAYLKDGGIVRASRSFSVTLLPPVAKWLELRANSFLKENFDSMGGGKNAEFPAPWRVAYTNEPLCYAALDYNDASPTNTQTAMLGSKATTAGIYNICADDVSTDRAVGFLSSGEKFITCTLMVPLKNVNPGAISSFRVSFAWEKWRMGNAKKLDLCYSTGGPDWNWTKIDAFHKEYGAEEGETTAWATEEEDVVRNHVSGKVNVEIPADGVIYLGWFYSADTKKASGSAQCWAVDDVRISTGNPDMTVVIMK